MKRKLIIFSAVLFFICFSCGSKPGKPISAGIAETSRTEDAGNKEEQISNIYTLTFLAAGDNLFHDTVINSSKVNGTHDFSPIYSEVKDIIEKADLSFINQETVMAGESFGYSGFPNFNTPQALAHTLADTGFDIINIANNHTMDMGEKGLIATLDFLDTIESFTVIGARKSGDNQKIITKNNITLGFLSYTFSLNGYTLPKHNPNLVSMVNKEKMAEEISALRPLCDFLIVSMHWGDEYRLIEPNNYQKDLALFLAERNVDLIIGHHPHVLQYFEALSRPDGKETLCFYSLGNFASNQRGKERLLGALMLVTFVKEDTPQSQPALSIIDSGLLPVVTHYDRGLVNTKIYPLYLYTDDLLKKHGNLGAEKDIMDFFHSVVNSLRIRLIMEDPF